jgi:hypothetical protein
VKNQKRMAMMAMKQLDLFGERPKVEKTEEKKEPDPVETAYREAEEWSGAPDEDDSWRAPIPGEMELEGFTPRRWLDGLIAAKEHMIFLFMVGGGMCNARCESSWEKRAQQFVDSAKLRLEDAETVLRRKKYVHHSNYSSSSGDSAKVFVRWW